MTNGVQKGLLIYSSLVSTALLGVLLMGAKAQPKQFDELSVHRLNVTEPDGTLHGTIAFEQPVTVPAGGRQAVRVSPATHKQLRVQKPELWWPAGYGEPHLYQVELTLEGRGGTEDRRHFQAGIRQITFDQRTVPCGCL